MLKERSFMSTTRQRMLLSEPSSLSRTHPIFIYSLLTGTPEEHLMPSSMEQKHGLWLRLSLDAKLSLPPSNSLPFGR